MKFPVYSTHHGPVFKGIEDYNEMGVIVPGLIPVSLEDISVGWAHLKIENSSNQQAYFVAKAKTAEEFFSYTKKPLGSQVCFLWANTEGEIASITLGAYPLRKTQNVDGRYVKKGWLPETDWIGIVPYDKVPHVHNPTRGFVVNSNNKITSDNYIYDIGVGMTGTTRADRITEMI